MGTLPQSADHDFGVLKSDAADTRQLARSTHRVRIMNNFVVTANEQFADPLAAFGLLCDRAVEDLDCLRYEPATKRDCKGNPDGISAQRGI